VVQTVENHLELSLGCTEDVAAIPIPSRQLSLLSDEQCVVEHYVAAV